MRQPRRVDRLFGAVPRCLVGLHHGRGLRDADVDEVRDPRRARRGDRFARRSQIDVDELLRLGGRGARHADQLQERIGRRDGLLERRSIERIADDHGRAGRRV